MTRKSDILRPIRLYCIDCAGGSRAEVRMCPKETCPLYPFRFGKDPSPSKPRGIANRLSGEPVPDESSPFRPVSGKKQIGEAG